MPSTNHRDYYEILGIPRGSDEKTIKNAFRELALKFHPDRNKSPGAEEKFKEIAEAYAVLSDPKKRSAYDRGGYSSVSGVSQEDLFGGINFEEIFGNAGFGFGPGDFGQDFGESIFNRFFGGRTRRPEETRGVDLEVELEIPLEHVMTGGQETVRLVRMQTCPDCKGSGAKPGTKPRQCKTCQGSGRKTLTRHEGGVTFQQIMPCPDCNGLGQFVDKPCPKCSGDGKVEQEETLTVKIPIGVEDGMVLRVPGRGAASANPKGKPGDLLVLVRSKPDSRFERRAEHLWRSETIEIVDAVLGTNLKVFTLDGVTSVKIPPGIQPETVLRLQGKGLPIYGVSKGSSRRGDLFLRIQIHVPQKLTIEERKLFERLKLLSGK